MFAAEKFDVRDADTVMRLAGEICGLIDSDPEGSPLNMKAIKHRANELKRVSRGIRKRHVASKADRGLTPKLSDHFPERGDPPPEPSNWEPVESLRDRIAMNAPPMPPSMENSMYGIAENSDRHVKDVAAEMWAEWSYCYANEMLKQRNKS